MIRKSLVSDTVQIYKKKLEVSYIQYYHDGDALSTKTATANHHDHCCKINVAVSVAGSGNIYLTFLSVGFLNFLKRCILKIKVLVL